MFRQIKLKNGITLITVPVVGTKATTILAMFPVGSRYETGRLAGASHFVEHLLFKGTKKRLTALDISRELDAVGANYNAFTSKDCTGYYIKIVDKKQNLAYNILADMIFNSTLDAEEVKREKGVIIEEMRMYEDNPTMKIDCLLDKIMYQNNSLGLDIIGTAESIKNITRDELYNYYRQAYNPRNMILVVAGSVDQKKMKNIEQEFGLVDDKKTVFNKNNFPKFVWPKAKQSQEKRLIAEKRKIDQAQVMMGWPGIRYNDPRHPILAVLLSVLSGGMSSRLFLEVRERRGLAYMIRASHEAYRDVGNLSIQAGLDPARLGEAVKVIRQELKKISSEPVSPKELLDAKNNIIGKLALSMEDSSNQAMYFASSYLFKDKLESVDKKIAKIKKVTAVEVRNLAKSLFLSDRMCFAIISNLDKKEVLKIIK
jgi:predicted Zn-dependent peptidase